MTRPLYLIILLLAFLQSCGSASAARYEVFSPNYDGSMSPYDFSAVEPLPAIPDSLRPVYICYVARHGARYLSSENKVLTIERRLDEARSHGTLTGEGRKFLALLQQIRRVTDSQWGALNAVGINEQNKLASEMYSHWPMILNDGTIRARSTYVPRVILSMYTFCHSLAGHSDSLEIYTDEGHQNDKLLRYFDTDSCYVDYLEHGAWRSGYDSYLASNAPYAPALRLVGSHSGLDTLELRHLTMDMYAVLQSLRAGGMTPPTSQWMTPAEYRACWQVSNLKHYLQRVANRYSDIPASSALPLLRQLALDADSSLAAIGRGEPSDRATLYFGHAETLMPLFSLMQLPGCSPCYDDCVDRPALAAGFENLPSLWDDTNIVPLAANLEMVYFISSTGRYYLLMRLNGHNIPPRENMPVINPWSAVKRLWRI